jgi:transposase
MRLQVVESKNAASLYIVKSISESGKRTNKVVEILGTVAELKEKLNGKDPYKWGEERAAELTRQEKEQRREIIIKYSPIKSIPMGEQRTFNGGYLFLQQIYHELGIHKLCQQISKKYKFEFSLDAVLSRLVYGRIIFPASKLSTSGLSKRLIEQPVFELQHIYRALEVIAKEMDFIQSELYVNSIKIAKRKTGILYYDVTNYFFEIEQEDGLKQYGYSKEHRPSPITQMGLFMDGDGMPLAFCINDGNTNEQVTLRPLEEKILDDFNLSRFVVCTDAGLSSTDNRKFNNQGERAFITTQSIKKLKKHLKAWALDPTGWQLPSSHDVYDISGLDEEKHKDSTFYKERWINEDGLEQKLIVTYSIKYRDYQAKIRGGQVERAQKLIETNPKKLKKASPNDYKRFILTTSVTKDGEVAEKSHYSINTDIIEQEKIYDGFYGVCTNLEDGPEAIIAINHRRWEIEECFRIMKSEFKARPVYLSRDDRIKAHFMTCFIALLIYRLLEKKLGEKFTCSQIISELREMNFFKIRGEGYVPAYVRTDFTDALHEAFGFRTDYEIVPMASMKKIIKGTKNPSMP